MPKAVLWVESTGVHWSPYGVQWSPYGLWGGQKSIVIEQRVRLAFFFLVVFFFPFPGPFSLAKGLRSFSSTKKSFMDLLFSCLSKAICALLNKTVRSSALQRCIWRVEHGWSLDTEAVGNFYFTGCKGECIGK